MTEVSVNEDDMKRRNFLFSLFAAPAVAPLIADESRLAAAAKPSPALSLDGVVMSATPSPYYRGPRVANINDAMRVWLAQERQRRA